MVRTKELVSRLLTDSDTKAFDMFDWVKRDAKIDNPMTGEVVFEQKNVEFPDGWSQNAVNIVTQKYFCGEPGSASREKSLKQLVSRVADTVADYGYEHGYFDSTDQRETFREELKFILASQRAAFNSPVWFNIGAKDRRQQASACFILRVEDNIESILNWYVEEGRIFKGGSGSGINLSTLRSSKERIGGSAGFSSGPVSFMRGADASAGTIKSGGKTRRAAKMVMLNIDHPDVEEFIWTKVREERKARALTDAGFDMSLDGRDNFSVQYQNANNSVRVSDEFMQAALDDKDWDLKAVTTGKTVETTKARDLLMQVSEAAWECADPGMQFTTTIQHWHTTPNAGPITGSNPCSEYMHIDNSACNLASINLLKFLDEKGNFDVKEYRHVARVIFVAQEILVGYSVYPTEAIAKNTKRFRQLGLGYANLGALLMAKGLPYDSDEGRNYAAALTAIMAGEGYLASAEMAGMIGPFAGYNDDDENMLRVLRMHRDAVSEVNTSMVPEDMMDAASSVWDDAVKLAEKNGVRNAQATVLAPTGTISFLMDCDTTGIEPDLGLVKHKKLVGGGTMKIVNNTVKPALETLGYSQSQVKDIMACIDKTGSVIDAPHMSPEHYDVFATSMGDNTIHHMGHIKMMGAVQKFLSGAISKTVNLPSTATVEDVYDLHVEAWRHGLKAVAIYRDATKVAQPMATTAKEKGADDAEPDATPAAAQSSAPVASQSQYVINGPAARELPRKRRAVTYKFRVAGQKGYFTVGEYDDGRPGELFVSVSKRGSTMSGIMDSFAFAISHGLQHGVPLRAYVKSFIGLSFPPAGVTDDPEIPTAASITEYIFKRLALDYLSFDERLELGLASIDDISEGQTSLLSADPAPEAARSDLQESEPTTTEQTVNPTVQDDQDGAPLCDACGSQTQRSGSCYACPACGMTTGCG